MITISNVRKVSCGEKERVYACITIPDEAAKKWYDHSLKRSKTDIDYSYIVENYCKWIKGSKDVYYEVSTEYADALVTETADCFVVGMLYYAMSTGENIVSEVPVSRQLMENLNNTLLPLIGRVSKMPIIQVIAESYGAKLGEGEIIGTGMSAGVDSLHTLYLYGNHFDPEQKLTHLTQFDVGAERYYFKNVKTLEELQQFQETFEVVKNKRVSRAKQIADMAELGFLQVDSNLQDIYQGLFEESHIYRTASAVLAVQRAVKKYYIASSGCAHHTYNPSIYEDPAYYEQMSVPMLSTDTTRLVSASKAYTRVDKINDLKKFEIARTQLCVCGKGETPCYNCGKEWRTFVIFDILDCAEQFASVFDMEKVKAARDDAYFWLLRQTEDKNPSNYYLYLLAKEKGLIPTNAKLKYAIHKVKHFLK